MWGKVRIHVMKYPIVLQAQSSIQAHSKSLRIYGQIGISERGKLWIQMVRIQQSDVVVIEKTEGQ